MINSQSVKDIVIMYGIRRIGQNLPEPGATVFIYEAMSWLFGTEGYELIVFEIRPLEQRYSNNVPAEKDQRGSAKSLE